MANRGLWKKEITEGKFRFLIGLVILGLVGLLITLTYDYTIKLLEIAPVPAPFRAQVELLKDYRLYIWSQWFNKNLLQFGSLLAIIFGAGIISTEVSRQTIAFLLARPLSRPAVFTVKYVVGLAYLILVTVISTIFLYLMVLATGHGFPLGQLVKHTVMAIAGMGVIFSIAAYFSTVFDRSVKAGLVSGLVALALAGPGFSPGLMKYSLYYQMAGIRIIKGEGFPWVPLVILGLVSVALYGLGRSKFLHRDL